MATSNLERTQLIILPVYIGPSYVLDVHTLSDFNNVFGICWWTLWDLTTISVGNSWMLFVTLWNQLGEFTFPWIRPTPISAILSIQNGPSRCRCTNPLAANSITNARPWHWSKTTWLKKPRTMGKCSRFHCKLVSIPTLGLVSACSMHVSIHSSTVISISAFTVQGQHRRDYFNICIHNSHVKSVSESESEDWSQVKTRACYQFTGAGAPVQLYDGARIWLYMARSDYIWNPPICLQTITTIVMLHQLSWLVSTGVGQSVCCITIVIKYSIVYRL